MVSENKTTIIVQKLAEDRFKLKIWKNCPAIKAVQ